MDAGFNFPNFSFAFLNQRLLESKLLRGKLSAALSIYEVLYSKATRTFGILEPVEAPPAEAMSLAKARHYYPMSLVPYAANVKGRGHIR